MTYLKFLKKKKAVKQEFYIRQNYPSEMAEKLRHPQILKTETALLVDQTYKKC